MNRVLISILSYCAFNLPIYAMDNIEEKIRLLSISSSHLEQNEQESSNSLKNAIRWIQKIPQCVFNIEIKSYPCTFPQFQEETNEHSNGFCSRLRGNGMEKNVLILDDRYVALLPKSNKNFIPLLEKKEIETYQILSSLGLRTQSSAHLGSLKFQDDSHIEAIIVENFDYTAKNEKARIIELKSSKIKNKFGEQSIFLNNRSNFDSLEYNINLLTPLMKDFALWWFIGHPTHEEEDSLNLIIDQYSNNQVRARLFLFDMYNYAFSEINQETTVFNEINEEISENSLRSYIRNFYSRLVSSSPEEELLETFGDQVIELRMLLSDKIKQITPDCVKIFNNEFFRLKNLMEFK
jgi:hypothetical protein